MVVQRAALKLALEAAAKGVKSAAVILPLAVGAWLVIENLREVVVAVVAETAPVTR